MSLSSPPFRTLKGLMVEGIDAAIAKRTVAETATAGQLVGDPVTAEDRDSDDVLTYTLMEEAGSTGKFVIDRETGQISVAKGTGAKFNVTGDVDNIAAVNLAANSYTVTVVATDPKGVPTDMTR